MGLSESMKALSDPIRRQILEQLKTGPKTAGEIASQFKQTNATISYHLKLLKEAQLISENRRKNYIYYSLNASVFEDILTWLYDIGGKQNES